MNSKALQIMSFTFREEIADVTTVPGGDVIFPTSVTTYIELSRVFEKVLKFGIFMLIWNSYVKIWNTYGRRIGSRWLKPILESRLAKPSLLKSLPMPKKSCEIVKNHRKLHKVAQNHQK